MVFYGIVIVALIGFVVWFVRTPNVPVPPDRDVARIPAEEAGHAMPYLDNSSAYFRKND